VTWNLKPHTKAKHEILRRYLEAWFPILSKWSGRIIYLDGFAGPGIYSGGEDGSPVIALQVAVDHVLRLHFKEIVFFFIEKDQKRAKMLQDVLKKKFPNLPKNIRYSVKGAEFAPTLEQMLNELEKNEFNLAPTFAFLDPFGFSGLPMKLIGRMMKYKKCEVLITFMVGFIKRFLDEKRESALNDLFETNEWKKAHDIVDPARRLRYLIDLYEKQLKCVGGAEYVRSFGMTNKQNQIIYYLVFGTRHPKGLEVMKEAMWKADRIGSYGFSDLSDPKQIYIIDYTDEPHWIPNTANMVFGKFRGKNVSEDEVHKFVVTDTPFLYRKSILKYLETRSPPKIVKVSNRKRALSYPEGCSVTFCK